MQRILISSFLFLVAFASPLVVSAHQPKIVNNGVPVVIEQPEISKAYYGQLQGEPQVFKIHALSTFKFYMNVLVPDVAGAKKDVSAALVTTTSPEKPVAIIDGITATWTPFFEEFARDDYFKGPEFRSELPAGTYEIRVWSSNNDSAYSLAIGEEESFSLSETISAFVTIPQIKSFFFHKPAYSAFLTPFFGFPILIALGMLLYFSKALWSRRNQVS